MFNSPILFAFQVHFKPYSTEQGEHPLFQGKDTVPKLEQPGEERETNQEQEQTNTTMKNAITKSARKQAHKLGCS